MGREWKTRREKGDKRGRVEKNGGGGEGASWLCGMDAPGIWISNKKPKLFWPLRNQQAAGMRWRGIGGKARKEGMRGGRKKDLAEGPRGL